MLDKLISNYERVYEGPVDELVLLDRCQNAITSIEKVEKEIDGNLMLGTFIFILHIYAIWKIYISWWFFWGIPIHEKK